MSHEAAAGMNTGPLRSTLGPLKSNVTRHLDKVKNLLAVDRPKDDADELQKHIEKLHVHHDNLNTATTKLQNKLDEWSQLLQTTEDLHTDEQDHFDRMSADIINLNAEGDDLLGELNVGIHYCQSDLDRLVQAQQNKNDNTTAADQSQNAAGSSISTANQQIGTITGIQSGPPVSHSVQTGPAPVPPPHVRAFKAPKLKLPTFSGDYKEFKQFWGIFQATIDDDQNMTNIEKFTYLLSVLEGDAKGAITGIVINNDNYDVAVNLLKSRFDRADERMITLLYSELARIPSCTENIGDKQRTLDNCERIFRLELETAGEAINSNKALVITLLTKFPPGTVRDLQRYYGVGTNNTLTEVRAQLQKSIMDEETTASALNDLQSMQFTKRSSEQPQRQERQLSPDASDYTGTVVFENSTLAAISARNYYERDQVQTRGAQMLTPPGACYFCGEHHFNNDCIQYTTAAQRVARLAAVNRCLRCMKRHDPRAPCPFRIKCIYCHTDHDHMTALCGIKYPDQPSSVEISQPDPASTNPTTTEAAKASNGDSVSSAVTALNAEIKPALFQTAKAVAINPKTGQQHTLRLAMDTMSSRSYITDDAAQKLGLTTGHNERLNVNVFGTDQNTVVQTSRVQFDVALRDGTRRPINANTTKVICKAGTVFNDWSDDEKKALSHVSGSLADDPFDTDGTIDVLIGSSSVWEFIESGRLTTTAPCLFLIPSKLGLMLAGEAERTSSKPQSAFLCLTDTSYPVPIEPVISSESDDTENRPSEPSEIVAKDDPIETITDGCKKKVDAPSRNNCSSFTKKIHKATKGDNQRAPTAQLLHINQFLAFLFKLVIAITLLLMVLGNRSAIYPDVDSTPVIQPAGSTVQSRPGFHGYIRGFHRLPSFCQTILLRDSSVHRGWRGRTLNSAELGFHIPAENTQHAVNPAASYLQPSLYPFPTDSTFSHQDISSATVSKLRLRRDFSRIPRAHRSRASASGRPRPSTLGSRANLPNCSIRFISTSSS